MYRYFVGLMELEYVGMYVCNTQVPAAIWSGHGIRSTCLSGCCRCVGIGYGVGMQVGLKKI